MEIMEEKVYKITITKTSETECKKVTEKSNIAGSLEGVGIIAFELVSIIKDIVNYKQEKLVVATPDQPAIDAALAYIKSNLTPDEVFSIQELESWARDSGFYKEGDIL